MLRFSLLLGLLVGLAVSFCDVAVAQSPGKKPATKKSATKKSATKKPAAKKPATKKPVAKKPAAKKPVAKKPVAKKPAAKKSAAKKPAAKKPIVRPAVPEYRFLTDELAVRKDGKLMWFYRTNHVGAGELEQVLKELKLDKNLKLEIHTRKRARRSFVYGTRGIMEDRINLASPPSEKIITDPNSLLLVFPPAYKEIIEEFLDRFDIPEPQVFIKAKVVEVTLDSSLDLGMSTTFNRTPAKPNAFFRGFTSTFKPAAFSDPNATGLSMFFDNLGEKYGTLQAEIHALQEKGSANILSEPSIVAAQGQLATLVTGTETPISEITVTSGSERISTKFKDTGIRLDFMPLHIGREYCKLRIRVEVSSVTDFLTTQGKDISVQSPVIAQRNSETVVTVRDGMTLVIGGLYATSEIDNRDGIPILMDIPGLKYLFSRTKKTKVKSELDFFVTPFIVKHRLDAGVFAPPGEAARLQRLREGKKTPSHHESDTEASASRETDSEAD